ncbi:MAG TPA: site-2 protease family protein [Planctomycetota bacterium]
MGSIKIGSAFGIPVRIHLTFLLLAWALVLFTTDPLRILGLMAVVFGCVLLHELGHSLVARGFGLRVADITLWPLGGMARMSEIPENSRIEALIAIAGPAVNFALAGLAVVALSAGTALGLEPDSGPERFLWFFLVANVIQGGFNLVPAFPMDGGRLLRAFLGRKRDWLAATELAVRVGRVIAGLFLVGSLFAMVQGQSFCMLPLVALFVWFEGTRELWSVRIRHGILPFGAGARAAATGAPRDVGVAGPGPQPEEPPEPGTARRPRTWLQRLSSSGGFSEEEIRRLEAHRGPLRNRSDPPV